MFNKIVVPFLAFIAITGILKADVEDFNTKLETLKKEAETFNKSEQCEIVKASVKTNIRYLEHRVRKKIKRTQARIERNKSNLDYNLEQDEYQKSLDKINSLEKRLETLKEILSNIESMKSKV